MIHETIYNNHGCDWEEIEVPISQVEKLLETHEVEVSSPDGWVGVNFFLDKGMFEEYILKTDNGFEVRCNQNHLFKTENGWKSAISILESQNTAKYNVSSFNTIDGWSTGWVTKTGKKIPIVDISVNHPNQRYFTDGIESHNTGVGKSLFMCHCAAQNMLQGQNVLYITMEMAEEEIGRRIDANLMGIKIDALLDFSKEEYTDRINKIKAQTAGKLVIKEYPGGSASTANFRYLLNELKTKKTFIPKVIYVDYLNIMASGRMKMGGSTSSYSYVKAIVEELRALAQEFDLPIITATQVNRAGMTNSDFGIEDTPESIGVSHTVDLMIGMISTEELEAEKQIMFKQLKNRYGSITDPKRFLVGIDKPRMKFFNIDSEGLVDDTPVMNNTSFGERLEGDLKTGKLKKQQFKGLQ